MKDLASQRMDSEVNMKLANSNFETQAWEVQNELN